MVQKDTDNILSRPEQNKSTSKDLTTGYERASTSIDITRLEEQVRLSKSVRQLLEGVLFKKQIKLPVLKSQKEINDLLDDVESDMKKLIHSLTPITLENMSQVLYKLFLVSHHALPKDKNMHDDFYAVYSEQQQLYSFNALTYAVESMIHTGEYPSIPNISKYANQIDIPKKANLDLIRYIHGEVSKQLGEE